MKYFIAKADQKFDKTLALGRRFQILRKPEAVTP